MSTIMELAERFVNAVERIASDMETERTEPEQPSDSASPSATSTNSQAKSEPKPEFKYPAQEDRDGWLKLAEEKGIGIPKGTRTPTIIKLTMNKINSERSVTVPAQAVEADPFGAGEAPEPPRVITLADIKGAFKGYIAKHGMDKAAALLKEIGGPIDHVDKLDESRFVATMEAIEKEM